MSSDFIADWLKHSDPVKAPRILRLWSGLGALSCILSRRVWLQANSRYPPLYPNIYIMLLADPGIGKDLAINMAESLCAEANRKAQKQFGQEIYHNGGESISPKGLLDKLRDSKQVLNLERKGKQETVDFHSLTFFIGEATTAIHEYNPQLIGLMNEIYNCKPSFGETIRGIQYDISNPHLVLLMGNQPSTFYKIFPPATFSMGFTARLFLVFSDEKPRKIKTWLEPSEEKALNNSLWPSLVQHLLDISQWSGELLTTRDFRRSVTQFEDKNPAPVPGDKYKHWNTRRSFNLAKLSTLVAASEKDQIISSSHFDRAVEYLFEIEQRMPGAFDSVVTERGYSDDLDNLPNLVGVGGVISQRMLMGKLARTRPPHEVGTIISQAVKAGILKIIYDETGDAPMRPLQYKLSEISELHTLQ